MASSVINGLQSVGRFATNWSARLAKIFKHKLFSKRKNLLIFGEHDCALYQQIYGSVYKHWQITRIIVQPKVKNQSVEMQVQNGDKIENESTEIEKVQQRPKKQTFYHEYQLNNNYQEIQHLLQGRQFDSVVVLPTNHPQMYNFDEQNIAVDYLDYHARQIMRNVFGYRLASKYLTTTGVLIFSGSQRDFLKAQTPQDLLAINKDIDQFHPSTQLIDCQTAYLGVMTGQRDHTDLNSWSLVAMSRQWINSDHKFLAKHYIKWINSQHLPMPGSFAFFKPKTQQYRSNYIEYI